MRTWLKQMRKDAGLSAPAVASKVKVSSETVYRWESGEKNPNRENMISLASLFGNQVYERFEQEASSGVLKGGGTVAHVDSS